MNHRFYSIMCGLFVSLGAIAQETATVQLEDTGEALINPGMGWTMHFYSNIARNYGSKLEPSDTLEDFPGVSTVYLRLPWAYLEPEEGKYNWAILDTPAQRWIAKGKKIALAFFKPSWAGTGTVARRCSEWETGGELRKR